MATDEEITIKIKADTSDFKKGMDEATDSVKDFEKTADSKKGFNSAMNEMSDTTDGVKDKFKGIGKEGKKSGGILGKAFGGLKDAFIELGASSKLASAGAVGVVIAAVGIVGKLVQVAYKKIMEAAGKATKMFDPGAFEKYTNKMNASLTRVKTSLGAVLEPLYAAMTSFVSWLSDAFNGVLETILKIYAFFVGFVGLSGTLSRNATDYSDAMEEATASADAGLSAFDKLNTLNTAGMGDESQAQRIRDMMADTALAAEGVRNSIADALNPMKLLSQLFKSLGLESNWNTFVQSGERAWDKLVQIGENVFNAIIGSLSTVWNTASEIFSVAFESLKTVVSGLFDIILEVFKNLAAPIISIFTGIWTSIFDLFAGDVDGAIRALQDGFMGAWDAIVNAIPKVWSKINGVFNNIAGALSSEFDIIGKNVSKIADSIGSVFSNLANTIKNVFNSVLGSINLDNVINGMVGGMKSAMNSIIGYWNNTVANLGFEVGMPDWLGGGKFGINTYGWKLPYLASGTVAEPNDPFLAIIGDNKKEREIVAPESVIEESVRRVLNDTNGGDGGKTIEVSVNLDGRKIARGMFDYLTGEAKRRGSSQWQ